MAYVYEVSSVILAILRHFIMGDWKVDSIAYLFIYFIHLYLCYIYIFSYRKLLRRAVEAGPDGGDSRVAALLRQAM